VSAVQKARTLLELWKNTRSYSISAHDFIPNDAEKEFEDEKGESLLQAF
jgi:hypothetical protein